MNRKSDQITTNTNLNTRKTITKALHKNTIKNNTKKTMQRISVMKTLQKDTNKADKTYENLTQFL